MRNRGQMKLSLCDNFPYLPPLDTGSRRQLYWLLRKRHLEKWWLKLNLQQKEVTERSTIWQNMSNPEDVLQGKASAIWFRSKHNPGGFHWWWWEIGIFYFFFHLLRKLCSTQQAFLSLAMSLASPQQVICSLCFSIASTWCGRLQSGSRHLIFSVTR